MIEQSTPARNAARILVVEDDANLRRLTAEDLAEAGYIIESAPSAEIARRKVPEFRPDLVISDLRLPGSSGLDLYRSLRTEPFPPAFLIVTAFGTIAQAVEALKEGADNFLTKPLDFEHLRIAISRALEVRALKEQVRAVQSSENQDGFHGIAGNEPVMRNLFEQIRRIGQAEGPVLIYGESGSGKELVARALHLESIRRDKPFVPVNCAGIPENLIESELFGHLAGAFTGAAQPRKGLFQRADGGILFLDEIAELPNALQAKLLRVLQEGTLRPVGADTEVKVDVRVIAATNLDLEEEMRNERFREDLFYRLEAFRISVPPLRDRGGDIDLLAARLLSTYSKEQDKRIIGFSDEALRLLHRYSFPGNIRELQNAIRRAATFCKGDLIEAGDLPEKIAAAGSGERETSFSGEPFFPNEQALADLPTLEEVKIAYVRRVLKRFDGNKRKAAKVLGIGRRTLYRYLGETDE